MQITEPPPGFRGESKEEKTIKSGEKFEIELRTGEDLQFCDILQGLIALMSDDFDSSNTWNAINDYYKMRQEEILESTA